MNISSEAKVGITVLLAAIAAIVGFRFMSDIPILRQSLEVKTTFQRIDGLGTGSQVFIRGVKVGSVNGVNLSDNENVEITMSLDLQRPLPENSVAYLTSLGLIEGKSIVIELGDSDEEVEFGGYIEGVYVESMMENLGKKGDEIGNDITSTLTEFNQFIGQLNETLDDEASNALGETLENTSKATQQISAILDSRQAEISRAIDSGSSMIAQLDSLSAENRPRVDSLMTALEENIRNLEQIRVELEEASAGLNQIINKINNGEGTLGKLVNNPELYDNLESATNELDMLLKGINEDPGRYLKHMNIIEIF